MGTAAAQTAPAVPPPSAPVNVAPLVLGPDDIAIYREAFAAARAGQSTRVKTLLAKTSDASLQPYVEATRYLQAKNVSATDLVEWLASNRDLAIADRVYRLAVSHATRTVRRGRKRIKVAVVTNIPAPSGVGSRSGGYEDAELPERAPASDAARAILPTILSSIKAGDPDAALALLDGIRATAPSSDIALVSHRICASYLAESRNEDAYRLATSISDAGVPQLLWEAGFAAYRLGRWADAIVSLEALAQNVAAQNSMRAQGAFWAARAYMQTGETGKVITLLSFAAKQTPSFYGLIAESALGIDSKTGFSDAVLGAGEFSDLMRSASARRAVALWQVGEGEFIGPELNRAFVQNDERLDPAMSALARAIGVPNVELRASEKSAARGVYLTGLFPVPNYAPEGGYRIDSSLVLAFARIESRFQVAATSPVGARGLMQVMPATAKALGVTDPDTLYNPATALAVGQRYIEMMLNRHDGNLLHLGGAYNAGPMAVTRWLATKAGRDDALLFVESIPVAETRSYVKRLMLYHWLYGRRFGHEANSLEETARGQWPIYRPAPGRLAATPATQTDGPQLRFSDAR